MFPDKGGTAPTMIRDGATWRTRHQCQRSYSDILTLPSGFARLVLALILSRILIP